MLRALKLFAVVILVALMPLRAVAGVTIGFCASGHQDMAIAAHADHGGHAQHEHGTPAKPVESSCNICVEHCSSAAFATPSEPAFEVRPLARERTTLSERHAAFFFPDQLDRPPLA
jgi:hypothetical protein